LSVRVRVRVRDITDPVSPKMGIPIGQNIVKGGSNPIVPSPHAPSPRANLWFLSETSGHIPEVKGAEYTQYLSLPSFSWPSFPVERPSTTCLASLFDIGIQVT
jgi:hypothetical protein